LLYPFDSHIIFSDAATSPQQEIAIGAFIVITPNDIENYAKLTAENLQNIIANTIVYRSYKTKKSTWAEMTTIITALHDLEPQENPIKKVTIYTDCQSLCDLLGRRKLKLQENDFRTRSGKTHPNADLYKTLFAITEKFHLTAIKIKGHDTQRLTIEEQIFSILDRLSRKKLREILNKE
jgi:ribonuclease HI